MQNIADERMAIASRLLESLVALGRQNPFRDPAAALVEELGLTPPQLHCLGWIGREGPQTMGELARRLFITDKSITGLVDRLERAQLVRRVREEQDRRVVRVALTERGAESFAIMRESALRRTHRLLMLLEPEECRVLVRIFERLRDAAHEAAPPPAQES